MYQQYVAKFFTGFLAAGWRFCASPCDCGGKICDLPQAQSHLPSGRLAMLRAALRHSGRRLWLSAVFHM
jgi:hypothetical protein